MNRPVKTVFPFLNVFSFSDWRALRPVRYGTPVSPWPLNALLLFDSATAAAARGLSSHACRTCRGRTPHPERRLV